MELAPNGLLDSGMSAKKAGDERSLHVLDQGKITVNSHLIVLTLCLPPCGPALSPDLPGQPTDPPLTTGLKCFRLLLLCNNFSILH